MAAMTEKILQLCHRSLLLFVAGCLAASATSNLWDLALTKPYLYLTDPVLNPISSKLLVLLLTALEVLLLSSLFIQQQLFAWMLIWFGTALSLYHQLLKNISRSEWSAIGHVHDSLGLPIWELNRFVLVGAILVFIGIWTWRFPMKTLKTDCFKWQKFGVIFCLAISAASLYRIWKQHQAPMAEFYNVYLTIPSASLNSLKFSPRSDVNGLCQIDDSLPMPVALHLKGSSTFEPIGAVPNFTIKGFETTNILLAKKFYLHNSNQDLSLLRDMLARSVFQDCGIPVPLSAHAKVVLNGRLLGIYCVVEGVNKKFLQRMFGDARGDLFEGDQRDCDLELRLPARKGESEIVLSGTNTASYHEKSLVNFMAGEILSGHGDGYMGNINNYWIYANPQTQRLAVFPHTLDSSFRAWRSATTIPARSRAAASLSSQADARALILDTVKTSIESGYGSRVRQRLVRNAAGLAPQFVQNEPSMINSWNREVAFLTDAVNCHFEDLSESLVLIQETPPKEYTFSTERWRIPPRFVNGHLLRPQANQEIVYLTSRDVLSLEAYRLILPGNYNGVMRCRALALPGAIPELEVDIVVDYTTVYSARWKLAGEWKFLSFNFVAPEPKRRFFPVNAVWYSVRAKFCERLEVDTQNCVVTPM